MTYIWSLGAFKSQVNIDGQQPFNDWVTFVEKKKVTMQCGCTHELEEIFLTD